MIVVFISINVCVYLAYCLNRPYHQPNRSAVVIFTDVSVKTGVGSGWAYSASVEGVVVAEESGAFVHTTSSM